LSSAGARRTTTSALALSGGHDFESVVLTGKRVTTNIGIIRDPGHTEPWINRPVGQAGISDHPGICRALGPGMGDHANNPISAEKNDRIVSLPSSPAESSPGSRVVSGAPSNSSSNASRFQSSGDAC
jgi:hypothetical protein